MSRPANQDPTLDYCNEVLSKITDQQAITWNEMFLVAQKFCLQDYDHHREFAQKHNLVPIAVLLISLLYVEHPLLCKPSGAPIYGLLKMSAEIIRAELLKLDLVIPVEPIPSFIHRQAIQCESNGIKSNITPNSWKKSA